MKILIISIYPAPYRVAVFNELGKMVELDVIFERISDNNRLYEWFSKEFINFNGILMSDKNSEVNKKVGEIKGKLLNKYYDAVILYDYSTPTSLYFALLCILNKVPYFLNCDGAFINKSYIKRIIKRFFIKKAVGYFASGKMAARYFEYFGAENNRIYFHTFTSLYKNDIYDEVCRMEDKHLIRNKLGIAGEKVALTASRFISSKRIEDLIKTWCRMPNGYTLIIAGAGELEEKYKQMVREFGLNNVLFTGFLNKNELFEYMRSSDIFVLPTESDTWGLVVNEAMACGLPVITTDKCIAGIELIENDVNGYLVSVGDIDGFSKLIKRVLGDEQLQQLLAKNSLITIKDYTFENIGISHFEVLSNFLTNQNKRN